MLVALGVAWLFLSASSSNVRADPLPSAVEIRRTTDGIPHVRAQDWHGLGYGYGYAQAQDVLCTLAEAFVTYRGRRALYFGAEERPQHKATFGQSRNIELDVFFRALIDDALIATYRAAQPPELDRLVTGFAEGYSRFVGDAKRGNVSANPTCVDADWVQAITAEDIYRRMYAAGLAAGYVHFVSQIVNANPPQPRGLSDAERLPDMATGPAGSWPSHYVGEHHGLGSNALALGSAAAGARAAVLLGNPHWYWGGPDRFYQAHLTIPGLVNVAGVSFLGVPVIMIGFNDEVAWSHTVSTARRFGLFELSLDAVDPTRYVVDGVSERMERVQVAVEVRGGDGDVESVARTLYRSRFGPVLDLGEGAPDFRWGTKRALSVRDVNERNFRTFRTFFRWNQARSLDEFIAIQREEVAIPWVNTIAIGRGDGRVWFGDVGAVPAVSDTHRQRCGGALSDAFARLDPYVPVLNGSRADCDWEVHADAIQAGAMPPAHLPAMISERYVANMNDSYWLTNPAKPLEGFDRILGGEGEALSLRGQAGHHLATMIMSSEPGSVEVLALRLREAALDARAHAAVRFRGALIEAVCARSSVTVGHDLATSDALEAPRQVDLGTACAVLAAWSGGGDADDRGSVLWDEWWSRLRRIPETEFYRVPFSARRPLDTPTAPAVDDPRVAEALGAAMLAMERKGWPLDIARGAVLSVEVDGRSLPFFGGCTAEGYFAIACAGERRYELDANSHGNSYLQVVFFTDEGVEAHTLLAHGQDERALDGGPATGPVVRYVRKDWLRMPFREADIALDPGLVRTVLRP
ncbi:MAG: penicillin acylase family protein [Rhodocyclaceae bacterium]